MWPFRRRHKKEHRIILIIGYAMTFIPLLVGIVLHIQPDQPYQVEYEDAGDSCSYDDDSLTIDRGSGSPLTCTGGSARGAPVAAPGPWKEQEVTQITDLATSLASDGLNDADEEAITDKAKQIGATHGYPNRNSFVELGGMGLISFHGVVLLLIGPRLEDMSRASINRSKEGGSPPASADS